MNPTDDRPSADDLAPIEGLLGRVRPVGPTAALRERILAMEEAKAAASRSMAVPAMCTTGASPVACRGGNPARREDLKGLLSQRAVKPARRAALYIWRSAVAAGIVAMILLNHAADRISARTAGQVGVGPAVWTKDCERTAQMLDSQGWGRRYLALGLMAGPFRGETPPPTGGG
jgi:hypothetical protein